MKLYLHGNRVNTSEKIKYVRNEAKRPLLDYPILVEYESHGVEINEDVSGNIFIEEFEHRLGKYYYVITSDIYKSKNSNWVKKFKK